MEKLEKVKIDFLVDTGATVNILTAGDYQRMCDVLGKRIPLHKTKTRIFAYGSSEPVSLEGKLTAMVESKHRVAAATFYVTKDTQGMSSILSYDTSACLRLITVSVNKLAADHKASKTSSNGKKKVDNEDIDSHKRKETLLKGHYPKVFEGVVMLKDYEQKLHINKDVPPPPPPRCTDL